MPESDFQREVLNRLIRIETKQDDCIKTIDDHDKKIDNHSERITAAEQSSKSAHHRIDGIFASAGILGTLAGAAVNFISQFWPKGGHG